MNNNFSGAIDARNKEKIKSEFTFIGIKESSVEKYEKIKDDYLLQLNLLQKLFLLKKIKMIKLLKAILIKLNLLLMFGNLQEI